MYASDSDLTRPMEGSVDKPSGQLLNDEVVIAQQGRTRVKDGEYYDRRRAEEELQKHLPRKRKAAPVKFLVDRMRFTKRGYHRYLPYRDIQHFYQPEGQSNAFVLFTKDKKGRFSYESYKCSSPQDVERVKELINHAGNDRQKLLNETDYYYPSSRRGSRASSASSEYYLTTTPSTNVSRASSMIYPADYSDVYYPPVEQRPVMVYETRVSRPASTEPRYEYRRAPSLPSSYVYVPRQETTVSNYTPYVQQRPSYVIRRSVTPSRLSAQPVRKSFMDEDTTYIRSDSVHGTQVVDNGPVYMYMSRSRSNLNQYNY
ncbi:unnamed protein product [Echinostoma caproni]|uniref:DUF5734 domain-containing protein n=1 Tax=Echinostoma caproni TaxID=27848 RepID=A0A183A783_9TREM|nr:unnamed protein product [Echinostoma caproni]